MASLYQRGDVFWIGYRLGGRTIQRSLHTTNERIARDKKKQIEYELMIGDLQTESRLELTFIVEEFCRHLKARSPHKARSNDASRLRIFFGPICESLQLGMLGGTSKKRCPDKYAHAHVKAQLLEDVSAEMINRFISTRLREDKWSPKTANAIREILHRCSILRFGTTVSAHETGATRIPRRRWSGFASPPPISVS